jgi:1-acyl-sn-glycerol-3-phosphate acyltransferase
LLYRILRAFLKGIFKAVYRFSVIGIENFPLNEPVVLVSNHASYLDPVVLSLAAPRQINFMAKAELFKYPIFNWLISHLGAFPVRRGEADLSAFRRALELLKDKKVVGIFPQGTRQGRDFTKVENGAVLLAQKSQASLLPVAVIGTDKIMPKGRKLPRFPKIQVLIGKPIAIAKKPYSSDVLTKTTRSVVGEIRQLLKEENK